MIVVVVVVVVARVTIIDYDYVADDTQYDVRVDSILRQKRAVLVVGGREFVYSATRCRCPRLNIGRQYVILGQLATTAARETRFELETTGYFQEAAAWDERKQRSFSCAANWRY